MYVKPVNIYISFNAGQGVSNGINLVPINVGCPVFILSMNYLYLVIVIAYQHKRGTEKKSTSQISPHTQERFTSIQICCLSNM